MRGISSKDGAMIYDDDVLHERIIDVFKTPLVTRVINRSYGSRIYEMVDSQVSFLELSSEIIKVLKIWIPEIKVDQVKLVRNEETPEKLEVLIITKSKTFGISL